MLTYLWYMAAHKLASKCAFTVCRWTTVFSLADIFFFKFEMTKCIYERWQKQWFLKVLNDSVFFFRKLNQTKKSLFHKKTNFVRIFRKWTHKLVIAIAKRGELKRNEMNWVLNGHVSRPLRFGYSRFGAIRKYVVLFIRFHRV